MKRIISFMLVIAMISAFFTFTPTASAAILAYDAVVVSAELTGDPGSIAEVAVGATTYTDAGMVDTIEINGQKYSGMKIRSLFSLASPCFTLTRQNGNFIFTTKGKGHGVGLSQNGANALAKSGYSWEEIILHYYQDVTII